MDVSAGKKDVAEIESRLRAQRRPGEWRLRHAKTRLNSCAPPKAWARSSPACRRTRCPTPLSSNRPTRSRRRWKRWPPPSPNGQRSNTCSSTRRGVKRFDAFLRIGKLVVTLIAGVFAAALVAATFNTIRLQIMANAAEIEVARFVGATDAFIRRPFQYFGALQGGCGGLLAAAPRHAGDNC